MTQRQRVIRIRATEHTSSAEEKRMEVMDIPHRCVPESSDSPEHTVSGMTYNRRGRGG